MKLAQLKRSLQLCVRMNIRIVKVLECPPALLLLLCSRQYYVETVSHPNSYAGYIEIAAAHQLLYNISINVVTGTAVFPPAPNPRLNKRPVRNI